MVKTKKFISVLLATLLLFCLAFSFTGCKKEIEITSDNWRTYLIAETSIDSYEKLYSTYRVVTKIELKPRVEGKFRDVHMMIGLFPTSRIYLYADFNGYGSCTITRQSETLTPYKLSSDFYYVSGYVTLK